MKAIINTCYGGFVLSIDALKRYLDLTMGQYFIYQSNEKGTLYKKSWDDIHEGVGLMSASTCEGGYLSASTVDLGESISASLETDDLVSLIDVCSGFTPFRTNETLIKIVEDLGEKASGPCSELRVVNVPDDGEYVIGVNDGQERICKMSDLYEYECVGKLFD